jgi:hypothetical protein
MEKHIKWFSACPSWLPTTESNPIQQSPGMASIGFPRRNLSELDTPARSIKIEQIIIMT